jgi:hypothetical protein
MWRYLVGLVAGVLLVAGGVLWWRSSAIARHILPDAPQIAASAGGATEEAMPDPPAASEKTREERRLSRIDHDKNGEVSRDEFLAARRRNFARLDIDGDGKLSFEEYAVKGVERFAAADKDKTGALNASEFATTRVVRKTQTTRCPPPARSAAREEG